MLITRIITCIVFIVTVSNCFAQQNNIWYFGKRAALNFNVSPPVPLHNSMMDADEGCASVCDTLGKLLFYTNGVTVYNRNHQVMLNGNGLFGNISAVQSSVIIPMPGSIFMYYIFTTDAIENNFAHGYNFSIVDMRQDNGLGEVVSKNNLLSGSCTERLAAARHADGVSVWVITNPRNSNLFNAWLVNCNGISPSPVTSTSGIVLDSHILMGTGMMKVSPDGKQLCQTHFPIFDDNTVLPNFFQLFDFDNQTGIISNARQVDPGDAKFTSCEYSSNSQLLYLSRAYEKKIDQYEARLSTAAAIVASRFTINTTNEGYYGIQLAPDEKIYLSSPSNFVGEIQYPNIKGAGCGFIKQAINVNEMIGGSAHSGFPNFINDLSFDGSNGFRFTILDSCTGKVQFNGFSTMPGTINWNWDFGDGSGSTLPDPVHIFSSLNPQYTVRVKIVSSTGCGNVERKKNIIPKGLSLDPGFNFNVICDSGIVRFQNASKYLPDSARVQFLWDFGDGNFSSVTDPVHNYADGTYPVNLAIKTTTACLDRTVNHTVVMQLLDIHAPPDIEIDPGQTVQLNVTGGGSSFQWTPPTGLSNATAQNPVAKPFKSTMYVVTAFNPGGCKDIDSVFIRVKPVPGIRVPTGFTPNNDGKNDILRPSVSDEYILHQFSIYNRWGQKVFSTSQKETGWNGKINGVVQDAAVYTWLMSVTNTNTGLKEEWKGIFVIIR